MIISRTPYRVSFFGGGTDYPSWYLKEGGEVLSTTIDKYCYISCRFLPPFFNIKHRIVWSHIETVSNASEILHPVVREGIKYLNFDESKGLELHHQGDLPARAGIGSSAAFVVGLIKALSALKGQYLRKQELALRAIELEQSILKENVGSQDQVAAAFGGFNRIYFLKNGEIRVEPLLAQRSRLLELNTNLLLLYTGTSRLASEVAAKIVANLTQKKKVLKEMQKYVEKAVSILKGNGSLDDFGLLMHENWLWKQQLSDSISNDQINEIYETAQRHGALGGKLLGAGAAGFMLFYVPPEKQKAVKDALNHFLWVPFKFEETGSTLIDLVNWTGTTETKISS